MSVATFKVDLNAPAHEMAREEILKQAPFLSKDIRNVRFSADNLSIEFEAPDHRGSQLTAALGELANRTQRALRGLERKIVFHSEAAGKPAFATGVDTNGIRFLGTGQVAMYGIPLRLFQYFDRVFKQFGAPWNATPLMTPTLIPDRILSRCDYFRSFPQSVTFASHLQEDVDVIAAFRERHESAGELDGAALADMDRPEACLSPAVCYHVYHLFEGRTVPVFGTTYSICGKCFRYESSNITDLRRLWEFTLREVVFLGARKEVLQARDQTIEMMAEFINRHRIAGEIRTASDPFFVAPDSISKTYFQLSSDSKFEVSLMLAGGERIAVGSHNYHSDFFGRVFHTDLETGGPMHSVCVGFGLERWVYAFLQQHGSVPSAWPDAIRNAPEFQDIS